MIITDNFEALVLALTLFITAPTHADYTKVTPIIRRLARGMGEVTIERAKKTALMALEAS